MSDLQKDRDALSAKGLQLERQIVFARGYRGEPSFIGFESPALKETKVIEEHLKMLSELSPLGDSINNFLVRTSCYLVLIR